jgi:hypothetical protein
MKVVIIGKLVPDNANALGEIRSDVAVTARSDWRDRCPGKDCRDRLAPW